jgi:tRNA modification GTPase
MDFSSDDTITAVSTAPGRGGIALVRISGPRAFEMGSTLGLKRGRPREALLSFVHDSRGRTLDRVLVTHFENPHSYTGEDTIEISCHGGALISALIVDATCSVGARVAGPGEFTKRAYLNGKLDLIQAEATLDMIDSTSLAYHGSAMSHLSGALSDRVMALRQRLLEVQAAIGYDIDFPEEDDGPIPTERILSLAEGLKGEIEYLLRYAPEGTRLRSGALTVISGRPNVGKSSLFNVLQGRARSIVTETPGTTRDAVEADITIGGYPFTLVDTAGVRDDAEPIEELGIEMARGYLDRADVILLCVDHGRSPSRADLDLVKEVCQLGATLIIVRTKADLTDRHEGVIVVEGRDDVSLEAALSVSSITGEGLPELRDNLVREMFANLRSSGEPALVTRKRHIRALESAQRDLKEFDSVVCRGYPMEIANTHLTTAADALESLIGVTDVEDVLDSIFQLFCVGK